MPCCSTGFWVAITRKVSGRTWRTLSTVTCRSAIASSRALWVRGVARLISSARRTSAKTGPGRNSNSRVCWSKTRKPVMSPGSRSGVHWTRANAPPTARARALASVVLPRPGRSSTSRWPWARRQASTCSTTSGLAPQGGVEGGAEGVDGPIAGSRPGRGARVGEYHGGFAPARMRGVGRGTGPGARPGPPHGRPASTSRSDHGARRPDRPGAWPAQSAIASRRSSSARSADAPVAIGRYQRAGVRPGGRPSPARLDRSSTRRRVRSARSRAGRCARIRQASVDPRSRSRRRKPRQGQGGAPRAERRGVRPEPAPGRQSSSATRSPIEEAGPISS